MLYFQTMTKTILAIETSCDETAMAVIKSKKTVCNFDFEIISNVVASQIDIHKKWGGVYPELASRAHLEAMIPVLQETLQKARNSKHETRKKVSDFDIRISDLVNEVDFIAVTYEPGLVGSLLMGIETAQILGAYFDKPVVKVNHLEGHVYASFACLNQKLKIKNQKCKENNSKFKIPKKGIFPILALVVSGGHTSLILMCDHLKYKTVAETIDDAAGEAFDKVARIIGLSYPGGPEIEKLAKKGDENAYDLPIGLNGKQNFSFSGLKTAVLYLTKNPRTDRIRKYSKTDLAASFQKSVADTLIQKTRIAMAKYRPKTLILTGGVSANSYIRNRFGSQFSNLQTANGKPLTVLVPPPSLSTDNAVGIGIAGALRLTFKK